MSDYYTFVMNPQRDIKFDELLEWVRELRRRGRCVELDTNFYLCHSKHVEVVTDFKNIIDITLKDPDEHPREGALWTILIVRKEFWDCLWGSG